MDYLSHIARDLQVCSGESVIKGTRVTLRTAVASLAEGASADEIAEDFPRTSQPLEATLEPNASPSNGHCPT